MSAFATVELDDRQLLQAIDDYASRGKNLKPVMRLIALDLQDRVEDNFAQERGFKQGAWPPLAPATLKRRRMQGRGAKILQDTGVMAGSITPDYEENFAEVFSTIRYSVFHTSSAPRKLIPLRNFFDIDMQAAQEEAAAMILEGIV